MRALKEAVHRAIGRQEMVGRHDEVRRWHDERIHDRDYRVDPGVQILLSLQYREMVRNGTPLPAFDDVEFRCHSQNGEDGILLYIFSLIGTTNKRVVEACVEDGIQCNAANLIINHGWDGLLFDGSPENISRGREYYNAHKNTFMQPPTLVSSWITRDNLGSLIAEKGFSGEIDLLSLDVDGMEYYLWEALKQVNPRVVVVEFSGHLGTDRSIVVPYRDDFQAEFVNGTPEYSGASLPAFVKLARRKGYRLVGTIRHFFNAFFVRDDLGQDVLPEVSAEACVNPRIRASFDGKEHQERLKRLQSREFVEIS